MKYKFLGKPDSRFPNLVTGKVYDLKIETRGILLWTKPLIVSPIRCPYSSWEAFYRNWDQL